jgi:hypothetical protein
MPSTFDEGEEDLLADLRRVADRLDESPTVKQYKTYGKYHPSVIRNRFGTWNEAKKEAGIPVNESGSIHRVDEEDLINDLERVTEQLGESPTVRQYRAEGEYSIETFQRRFGSWNEAKEQADLKTHSQDGRHEYTDAELLADLREFAKEVEGTPTIQQYRSRDGPSPDVLIRRFGGSWNEAVTQAGLAPNSRYGTPAHDDEQELLDDLKRVAAELGESPSVRQYMTHGEYSVSAFKSEFGSWNNGKEQVGLDVHPPDEYIAPEELLSDLQRTADRLGQVPSKVQYNEWGEYSATLCQRRLGSWNDAIKAANLDPNIEIDISEEKLLDDIKEVASVVEDAPTVDDYQEYGTHDYTTVLRCFGSWYDALTAAECEWSPFRYSDKELLQSLRDVSEGKLAPRRGEYDIKSHSSRTIGKRFGSWWAGCVQAGLLPRNRRPLSPKAIHEYHRAALDFEPHWRTYALLFQFTGLPTRLIDEFSPDWVAERKRNIIRVPVEVTKSGDPWLFEYPETWLNPYTGQREPTELPGTLEWFITNWDETPYGTQMFAQTVKRIAREGDFDECRRTVYHTNIGAVPDISPDDLRMTRGVNLASQGVEPEVIARQIGVGESNWGGDTEDCYLYAYVHRKAKPSNYEPPDVVLDSVCVADSDH